MWNLGPNSTWPHPAASSQEAAVARARFFQNCWKPVVWGPQPIYHFPAFFFFFNAKPIFGQRIFLLATLILHLLSFNFIFHLFSSNSLITLLSAKLHFNYSKILRKIITIIHINKIYCGFKFKKHPFHARLSLYSVHPSQKYVITKSTLNNNYFLCI